MVRAMSQADVEAIIERELPGLPGWCTPKKGKRIAELARDAHLIVELGVFGGRSLVAMALALRDSSNDFSRVDGIDPYTPAAALEGTNDPANSAWWSALDYEAVARAAQEALYRLELMPYARLVRMLSREVVGFYADGTLDLLHQDANHAEETTCEEVALWVPKIRPGGYWIFDDTNWESTRKAQRELAALGFRELEDHGGWKIYQAPERNHENHLHHS
jgi:hypothetical protein